MKKSKESRKKSIIVFGGDGYIGWPLSLQLASDCPDFEILIVDNFLRRRIVESIGASPLIEIDEPKKRILNCQKILGLTNLSFIERDICSEDINDLFKHRNVIAVYNLAQQASAPFSMMSLENAILTARNNEIANLRVLHAMKDNCPEIPLIKLGSFGEYCTTNLDIPEGFFKPSFNKKTANKFMPYPRQSDDFYHVSKINDSNYIHVACKNWGIKVIEVMQSTIFGINTRLTQENSIRTRFDYDQCFGTIVNRFIIQAILGMPITVYGTGFQRTGLMCLQDSVDSLADLWRNDFDNSHRIINHVTEKEYSVQEIGEKVKTVANISGYNCEISHEFDPRNEQPTEKEEYKILTDFIENRKQSNFDDVLIEMFKVVEINKDRIQKGIILPDKW